MSFTLPLAQNFLCTCSYVFIASSSHWGSRGPPGRNLIVASETEGSSTVTAQESFWMIGLVLARTYHSAWERWRERGRGGSNREKGLKIINVLRSLWRAYSDGICQCAKLRVLCLPLHVSHHEWGMYHHGFSIEEVCSGIKKISLFCT